MSFNFTSYGGARSDKAADVAGDDDYRAIASVRERVVTAVAVTLAILFVSVVAVLMGMA